MKDSVSNEIWTKKIQTSLSKYEDTYGTCYVPDAKWNDQILTKGCITNHTNQTKMQNIGVVYVMKEKLESR